MLCRTASDLYWMARHVERVDNLARLLDLAQRGALMPERAGSGQAKSAAWAQALDALELREAYTAAHGAVEGDKVQQFLVLDPGQPASIYSCVRAARESGRAQRGAITGEMYEEINSTWFRLRDLDWDRLAGDGLTSFIDWIKRRSASFRGVTIGTMGRDEGYEFLRLGTFIERADFGVRLLGANFAAPAGGADGAAAEYYRMSALLQALSAFETFRKVYRDAVTPERVAELLILRSDMPRSLAMCTGAMLDVLQRLRGGRRAEVVRLAGVLAAETRYGRIDEILAGGLERYLDAFITRLHRLGEEITREFMLPTDVVAA